MRGIVNANDARNNNITKQNIHDEIYNIERQIRNFSSSNYRELKVNFTKVTNDSIKAFENIISVDDVNDIIIMTGHELISNDIIEIKSTDTLPDPLIEGKYYGVIVVDDDTIQLYEYSDIFQTPIVLNTQGSGIISIKKVTSSELFYNLSRGLTTKRKLICKRKTAVLVKVSKQLSLFVFCKNSQKQH